MKRDVLIRFVSFPPGAIIEVDGNYMGRAPIMLRFPELHIDKEQNISMLKVFVYPSQEGYCVQKTALNPYDLPETIHFDMNDCS